MRPALLAGALAALAPSLLLLPPSASANPATYAATPAITEGEREIELVRGAQRLRDGSSATGTALKLGYGIRSWWAALQANLNLLFERHLHAAEPPVTEFGYQWQLRWRVDPKLDWGAQGFGATGPWRHRSDSSEQSHQLGPALFGRTKVSPAAALEYDAALLFGTGGTAPKRALRARIEYEFFGSAPRTRAARRGSGAL